MPSPVIAKPHRLPPDNYVGQKIYFITILCHNHNQYFREPNHIKIAHTIFTELAEKYLFDNMVTVYMYDHLHSVLRALEDNCDLKHFIKTYKFYTTRKFRETIKNLTSFWHKDYYDHIIRNESSLNNIIRYNLENPVRKGYVKYFHDWKFIYSDIYSIDDFKDISGKGRLINKAGTKGIKIEGEN